MQHCDAVYAVKPALELVYPSTRRRRCCAKRWNPRADGGVHQMRDLARRSVCRADVFGALGTRHTHMMYLYMCVRYMCFSRIVYRRKHMLTRYFGVGARASITSAKTPLEHWMEMISCSACRLLTGWLGEDDAFWLRQRPVVATMRELCRTSILYIYILSHLPPGADKFDLVVVWLLFVLCFICARRRGLVQEINNPTKG